MRGEISKPVNGADIEQKHFESVNMQMGRVQLDSDWNEAFATLLKGRSRSLADLIGRQGSPNEGFAVGDSLLLDHLDSRQGWSLTGPGSWNIDYFKEIEGKGCFRVCGKALLARSLPELLKRFRRLRKILLRPGATPGPAKLAVSYKVSATDDGTEIRLLVESASGAPTLATSTRSYPCGGWQVLELDITETDLESYDSLSFEVATKGEVYLDRLVLYPGIITDGTRDFYIQGGAGTSDGAGRFYLDGLACVKEGFETYLTQKDYPDPHPVDLASGGSQLAYLDVWRRTVTCVEDEDILEVALNGPDTCTREQLVAQVKVLQGKEGAGCATDIGGALREREAGTLTAKLSPKAAQQKCDFRPELDYTGLDNSLYRIEIHKGGDKDTASFKWSRNNGADLTPIIELLSDGKTVVVPDDRNLCCGDLVELCDDVSDLADFLDAAQHGVCAVITGVDHFEDGVKITLDPGVATLKVRTEGHPKLRKWHGLHLIKDWLALDADGTPARELEHGIRLAFSQDYFYHGDYWQFRARVNSRDIDALEAAPPMGPEHHYAPLSVITWSDGAGFDGCRKLFPPLTDIKAADVLFDANGCASLAGMGVSNVQQAIEFLYDHNGCGDVLVAPGMSIQDAIDRLPPEGGSVYLCPGVHVVTQTIRINRRRNLTIRGDGSATCVFYYPGDLGYDEQAVKELKEERSKLREAYMQEFRRKPLGDRVKELNKALGEAKRKLSDAEKLRFFDLFRIDASHDIAFSRFLMLSFDTDSLVAVLSESKAVSISKCDLFNIAGRGRKTAEVSDDVWLRKVSKGRPLEAATEGGRPYGAPVLACVRFTDCCDLTVEHGRLLGAAGLVQQGGGNADALPVVDGLCCRKNRFRTQTAALALIEGVHVTVQENMIQWMVAGVSEQDWEGIEESIYAIFTLRPGCPVRIDSEIYRLVDKLLGVLFSCLGEFGHGRLGRNLGVSAFVLRESLIEGNMISGLMGISNFYGEKNRLTGNQIFSQACAVKLWYDFSTTISENHLQTNAGTRTAPAHDLTSSLEPRQPREPIAAPATAPAPESPPVSEPVPGIRSEKAVNWSAADLRDQETGGIVTHEAAFSLLECHFSDRLEVHANQFDGPSGMKAQALSPQQFMGILGDYGELWPDSLRDNVSVLLTKRCTDLMGLGPAIRLVETVLGFLAHGVEVDLVALLLANRADADDAATYGELLKNPLVKILRTLIQKLIALPLVSRTVITENRFDVETFGLLLKGIVPLGGSRIMGNRIAGAEDTAILWKALTVLSNPDFNGAVLGISHDLVVTALAMMGSFLAKLLKSIEAPSTEEETVSPIMVFAASMMLYGVGQVCPVAGGTGGDGTTTSDPDNPFEEPIKKLIAEIEDLLNQLKSDAVRDAARDLAAGDYLISMNQIHGTGNGIHTNIANCTIQSNLINVEQGNSCIEALFFLGHRLATHGKILDDRETKEGTDQEVEYPHETVAGLGLALMSLNPNALVPAGKALLARADQWNRLGEVFDGMDLTGVEEIDTVLQTLQELISKEAPAPLETLKEASTSLLAAIRGHLGGFGMILESPGVQVVANRIEAVGITLLGKNVMGKKDYKTGPGLGAAVTLAQGRRAPAGIVMTSGTDPTSLLLYLLLREETTPLYNLGGQGTRFSANSLQWGAGHGISLSSLPWIIDLRIEGNEIQNHGCAGILSTPLFSQNLCIKDNEINHCFTGRPTGTDLGVTSMATHLGGLMVSGARGVICSGNTMRACGAREGSWPGYGAVFFSCGDIDFTGNVVQGNGIRAASSEECRYISRGGAIFWGGLGSFVISNNRFAGNHGTTLFVGYYGVPREEKRNYVYETGVGDNPRVVRYIQTVQMNGNHLVLDGSPCFPASIWVGEEAIPALVCLGNQIILQGQPDQNFPRIMLHAQKHLFNGNQVLGNPSHRPVQLYTTGQGVALGNSLHRDLALHPSGLFTADHNIF
jgi:uncharacterized protein DUF6519